MTEYVIGGEFTFTDEMLEQPFRKSVLDMALEHHPDFHHHLTGGGYYSLKVILEHLKETGYADHPVLLPAYLCPTTLKPFRELNVPFAFYPVDHRLQPDLRALSKLMSQNRKQALLFIPYFGFDIDPETKQHLNTLRLTGVKVIEDRAQCLFPGFPPVGNYVFYSFRKFLPVDGSLLLSDEILDFQHNHDNGHYTALKKYGQQLRHRFLYEGANTEAEFLAAFEQAKPAYYMDGIAGFEMTNLALFPRLNIEMEIEKRRAHYKLLLELLSDYALFDRQNLSNTSPLCFPVAVKNRDRLIHTLKDHRIYAPVHWHLTIDDVPAEFATAHELSKSLLSLPLRTNLPEDAYRFMADIITNHMKEQEE
jgi:hypothetical protein